MSTKKRPPLPAPNMEGTDPDEVLRRRLSPGPAGNPFDVAVGLDSPAPAHTPSTERVRSGKGTRPDPDGMKRISLYVTAAAANALDVAAGAVVEALGGDVPRHVALSALLEAAGGQVDSVTESLVRTRTAELAARLQALQERSAPGPH